jgi:hypothetical protein
MARDEGNFANARRVSGGGVSKYGILYPESPFSHFKNKFEQDKRVGGVGLNLFALSCCRIIWPYDPRSKLELLRNLCFVKCGERLLFRLKYVFEVILGKSGLIFKQKFEN